MIDNDQFYTSDSFIKDAGLGLFTKHTLRQNKIILHYSGTRLTPCEFDILYPDGKANYALEIIEDGKLVYIDAIQEKCLASRINDAKGSGKLPNVQFTRKGYVKTLKKIYPDEELLIDYGTSYIW